MFTTCVLLLILAMTAIPVFAGGNARRPAIINAADRVVDLQRTDQDWDGTWYWYVGSNYDATNLTGITALGLLEAYNDTKDAAYLDAALDAANFISTHLGEGATGVQYHPRLTAPDIVFLHNLSSLTGDPVYSTRASTEWENIKLTYPTAGDLDALYNSINRRSSWDIAFFLEAAYLSEDATWADDAAAILADTDDDFYYGDTWWYALNVAGAIRALVNCGYADMHYDSLIILINELINLVDKDNGIDGWVQDTAYAIIAFSAVGGSAHKYANDLGRWLSNQQQDSGGWLDGGDEYPEVDGEALRALASTIATDVTIDGFAYGTSENMDSSWVKSINAKEVTPFLGE